MAPPGIESSWDKPSGLDGGLSVPTVLVIVVLRVPDTGQFDTVSLTSLRYA